MFVCISLMKAETAARACPGPVQVYTVNVAMLCSGHV